MSIPNDIRKEGRLGFNQALRSDGELIYAEEARSGEKYTCLYCQVPMHLTHSKHGEAYFALDPGCRHKTSDCEVEVDEKVKLKRFFNASPETVIGKLCHVPRGKKPGPGGPGTGGPGSGEPGSGEPGSGEPGSGEPGTPDPEKMKEIDGVSTLKQIYSFGYHKLPPYSTMNGQIISNYLLSYTGIDSFFLNPDFELGARIVFARLEFFDTRHKTVRFCIFEASKGNGDQNSKPTPRRKVCLLVDFSNHQDVFLELFNRFTTLVTTESGATKTQIKNKTDALIASTHWKRITPECKEKKCYSKNNNCIHCAGMYYTKYKSPKQIYFCVVK